MVRQARHGVSRLVRASLGIAGLASQGTDRSVEARLGGARQVWCVQAEQGMAMVGSICSPVLSKGEARLGVSGSGRAPLGRRGLSWRGLVRPVELGSGLAGKVCYGRVRMACSGNVWQAWRGHAWLVRAGSGWARPGTAGKACQGASGQREDWRVWAGLACRGLARFVTARSGLAGAVW